MKKLILVSGPAGIGKSTYCKKYAASHPDEKVVIIAADDTRKEMYGGYDKFPPDGNMMHVYERMIVKAANQAKENQDVTVIFDTTMLYDERRLFFVRNLPEFEHKELILLKLHDYSLCLKRNHERPKDKWVPDNIIMDMANHYEDPSENTKKHFVNVEEIYVD